MYTMWTFYNFSATQILREKKFVHFDKTEIAKIPVSELLECLNLISRKIRVTGWQCM